MRACTTPRWEIETALGAFKSGMKGNGVVLRSKTPAGAEQEIWALLCAYHAIREMIIAAATNPDRRGRHNPRHAKRSTSYPARPADLARRPGPRGSLTLVMLPMPIPANP